MQDRISASPGRVKLTYENSNVEYCVLERADEPSQEGTPLNKENLLNDDAVASISTATGVTVNTPSEALEALADNTYIIQPLSNGGTGQALNNPKIRVNLASNNPVDMFGELVSPGVDGVLGSTHLPIAGATSVKRGTVYASNGLNISNDGGLSVSLQTIQCSMPNGKHATAIQVGNLIFVWVGICDSTAWGYRISGISSASILDSGIWAYTSAYGATPKYKDDVVHNIRLGVGYVELSLDNTINGYMQYAPIILQIT